MPQEVARGPADARTGIRSNVFLNATIVAAGSSAQVRVRNISKRGALIDGSRLPSEGSLVHLKRGSLSAFGEIAWRTQTQCGIRFADPVDVPLWVRRVEQAGQDRVDRLIHLARGNLVPDPAQDIAERAEDSVARVSADLCKACELLAEVPAFVEQSGELLKLDAIAQRLANLVKSPSGP